MLNDATTLFRSGLIAIIPLFIILIKPTKIIKYKLILIVFIVIQLCFIVSWQINNQNNYNFLIGSYGRNLGFLTLIGFFITVFIFANHFLANQQKILNSFYLTLCLAQVYGLVQYFGLDPFDWANKTYKIPLTLGNPNFSSAFLGMMSIMPLYYFKNYKNRFQYLHLLVYLLNGFLILNTNSSQGFILYILSGSIFVLVENRELLKKYIKIISLSLILGIGIVVSFVSNNLFGFDKVFNSLLNALNLPDRFSHWSLAFRIFIDNPWFGVGLGDQQKFSSNYLTLNDAKKWGNYLQPDKAHSIPLDYFVEGGIFAGTAYLYLIILIFFYLYRLLKKVDPENNRQVINTIGICWTAYVLQTLFSPSHIFIDLIGFILAGAILGIYFNLKEKIFERTR
jgi:O-antigen ligase